VAVSDERGGKFLAAYALARSGENPPPAQLRAHLAARLPE
jgi:hypothetical protein